MKRFITIILVAVLVLTACIATSAHEESDNILIIGDVTIFFSHDSDFSESEQQHIAHHLTDGDSGNFTTFGLMCFLFGHNYTTESVRTVTHRVLPTSPRCFEEYFLVSVCSRCNDTKSERTNYGYIACCP